MLQLVDPYIGRYFSNHYVKNKILMMTDEEIEQMDEQLAEEQESLPDNMQGPVMGQAPDPGSEQAEPEDNSVDETEDQESLTPALDDEVNKSVVNINKKRK
jgi:hypothetical protein